MNKEDANVQLLKAVAKIAEHKAELAKWELVQKRMTTILDMIAKSNSVSQQT